MLVPVIERPYISGVILKAHYSYSFSIKQVVAIFFGVWRRVRFFFSFFIPRNQQSDMPLQWVNAAPVVIATIIYDTGHLALS